MKIIFIVLIMLLLGGIMTVQPVELIVNAKKAGVAIQQDIWGVFFERQSFVYRINY